MGKLVLIHVKYQHRTFFGFNLKFFVELLSLGCCNASDLLYNLTLFTTCEIEKPTCSLLVMRCHIRPVA